MPVTLVTGGTGYVGRFIVEALLGIGHDVHVMGRSADFTPFSGDVTYVQMPLNPEQDYAELFSGIDNLIHCAFEHVPGLYRGGEGDDPQNFLRANLHGSLKLFRDAKTAGVSRAVFLSSRAVYGDQPFGKSLYETTKANPDTLYGKIKFDVEKGLRDLASSDFKTISLRSTGVYGMSVSHISHKWDTLFADYLRGDKLTPRIGTEVHGDDLAKAVLLLLATYEAEFDLFNVSDILVDRIDILSPLKTKTKSVYPLPDTSDTNRINAMNCDRLRALGWTPGGRDKFDKAIKQLVSFDMR